MSASASGGYEPGRVYLATVRGQKDVRVFRMAQVSVHHTHLWATAVALGSTSTFTDEEVTTIRPLIVLDPEELSGLDHVLESLDTAWRELGRQGINAPALLLRSLHDQIEEQTKPPRIPEPGWSGVIEAHTAQNSDRLRWQRDSGDHAAHWVCETPLEYDRTWDVLIDPTLIREGLS